MTSSPQSTSNRPPITTGNLAGFTYEGTSTSNITYNTTILLGQTENFQKLLVFHIIVN